MPCSVRTHAQSCTMEGDTLLQNLTDSRSMFQCLGQGDRERSKSDTDQAFGGICGSNELNVEGTSGHWFLWFVNLPGVRLFWEALTVALNCCFRSAFENTPFQNDRNLNGHCQAPWHGEWQWKVGTAVLGGTNPRVNRTHHSVNDSSFASAWSAWLFVMHGISRNVNDKVIGNRDPWVIVGINWHCCNKLSGRL